MIVNVHERHLPAPPEEVGVLLDRLFAEDDPLWPSRLWPMKRSGELRVGAACRHDDVHYSVSEYEPGRRVWFRFTDDDLPGGHGFDVLEAHGGTLLRHTLRARPRGKMRILWPAMVRDAHDALLEDLLDNAERELTGRVATPNRYGVRIRVLRKLLGRGRRGRTAPATVAG
jgi:hypothetical protein